METGRNIAKLLLTILLGWFGSVRPAQANWTLNIAFRNPPYSFVGVNALYLIEDYGFEFGLGWLDGKLITKGGEGEDRSSWMRMTGHASMKYFFLDGGFRPYIMAGFRGGTRADIGPNPSTTESLGGTIIGGGVLAGEEDIYMFIALYSLGRNLDAQLGIGFDL